MTPVAMTTLECCIALCRAHMDIFVCNFLIKMTTGGSEDQQVLQQTEEQQAHVLPEEVGHQQPEEQHEESDDEVPLVLHGTF
ncbi:hypothetical protein NDU88_004924 [Pleurodeles waltl]|uniref:Uncharacterized protein n=1 Tax=Pleurodeles waltl TaxID=8319 RepID=A0AAV7TTF2_PLEWA|nr:hypothetical protein NDU88_004924 [Pleurodeles waltl]